VILEDDVFSRPFNGIYQCYQSQKFY
jgi:hypothetical protein